MAENVLVICAHSDDQILGAGGTLIKYAKEGKNVHTVLMSYGESSHPWLKESVTRKMRSEESEEANKVIGAKSLSILGFSEGKFSGECRGKLGKKLKEVIVRLKPNMIFTHSKEDHHPDHKTTAEIVLAIAEKYVPKSEVYCFDIWTIVKTKNGTYPKLVVDISKEFKTKLRALDCFESQWLARAMLMWSIYSKAFYHGFKNDVKYAEVFSRLR